ncbi:hypothetical protein Tco_1112278 [Tanacetum coccineum]|uniref:Uncharacterized protein n=1 Tax=Tanacetum coccineum TaxID=301880 RepID=A0ABQ5IQC3_9ASTR
MTRSTTKKLAEPLDEPEREFCRLRKAAWRQQQNESLAIAERNLFDDEASSSNNTGAKPLVPSKTLREHSLPSSAGFQNPITLPAEQTGRIVNSRNILLIHGTCTFQGLRGEDSLHHISWPCLRKEDFPEGVLNEKAATAHEAGDGVVEFGRVDIGMVEVFRKGEVRRVWCEERPV